MNLQCNNNLFAIAEHVAATADEAAKVREGMVIVRILDGIVKNKYANNPGKLAAWLSLRMWRKRQRRKHQHPNRRVGGSNGSSFMFKLR